MKPSSKWTLVIGTALLVAVLGYRIQTKVAQRSTTQTVKPAEKIPVHVTPAAKRPLVERVALTGVIRPRNEVDIFARAPGRVQQVLAKVGDKVTKGQVLAIVEHRETALQHQQASSQVEASAASLESAQANFASAKLQYERYQALRKENAVPQADLERVETAFQSAQAGLRAAEAQNRMAQVSRDLAGEALRNSRIVSPIDGSITKRNVNLGTQVSLVSALFQVQDIATLKLEGSVSASEYGRLKLQQFALVTVDDLPGQTFEGKLVTVSPTLDPQTRRAALEIEVANTAGQLLPNMFAKATLETGKQDNALTVPAGSVVSLPGGKAVYVVRDGKAVAVKAVLGAGDGDYLHVLSGLTEGEAVVVQGQEQLTDGAEVRIPEPNASAGAAQ